MSRGEQARLFSDFVRHRDAGAYAGLVRAHIDLVYSAAHRCVSGDAALAGEITREVFADLVARAGALSEGVVVAGWLYRRTVSIANVRMPPESRGTGAVDLDLGGKIPADPARSAGWDEVARVFDAAMLEIEERDGDALVLRLLRKEPLREVGDVLGLPEEAARRRIDRAVDHLGEALARRGVRVTSTVLAAVVTTHGVTPAPAGLATKLELGARPAGVVGGGWWISKRQAAAAVAVMVVALAGAVGQFRRARRLEAENEALRQQIARALEAGSESRRLAAELRTESMRREAQQAELMRLNRRLATLRDAERDNVHLQAQLKTPSPPSEPASTNAPEERASDELDPQERQLIEAKLDYTRQWGVALVAYARDNGGRLPASLAGAALYLPNADATRAAAVQQGIQEDQFVLAYQGSLEDLRAPERTLLLIERTPFQTSGGVTAKTYLFADGHSEVHAGDESELAAWERDRVVEPASP